MSDLEIKKILDTSKNIAMIGISSEKKGGPKVLNENLQT